MAKQEVYDQERANTSPEPVTRTILNAMGEINGGPEFKNNWGIHREKQSQMTLF